MPKKNSTTITTTRNYRAMSALPLNLDMFRKWKIGPLTWIGAIEHFDMIIRHQGIRPGAHQRRHLVTHHYRDLSGRTSRRSVQSSRHNQKAKHDAAQYER